jgi:hypothetical protein
VCRRPDLGDAVFRGVLPLPILRNVFREIHAVASGGAEQLQQSLEAFLATGGANTAEMLDVWACLAARQPRIVRTIEEAGPAAIWIGDVPIDAKAEIFAKTFEMGEAARYAAASSFRDEPPGATPGSGGPAVSDPPLVDVEHR